MYATQILDKIAIWINKIPAIPFTQIRTRMPHFSQFTVTTLIPKTVSALINVDIASTDPFKCDSSSASEREEAAYIFQVTSNFIWTNENSFWLLKTKLLVYGSVHKKQLLFDLKRYVPNSNPLVFTVLIQLFNCLIKAFEFSIFMFQ